MKKTKSNLGKYVGFSGDWSFKAYFTCSNSLLLNAPIFWREVNITPKIMSNPLLQAQIFQETSEFISSAVWALKL